MVGSPFLAPFSGSLVSELFPTPAAVVDRGIPGPLSPHESAAPISSAPIPQHPSDEFQGPPLTTLEVCISPANRGELRSPKGRFDYC
jgi:hypothetical protein